jgi:hypothetical protein
MSDNQLIDDLTAVLHAAGYTRMSTQAVGPGIGLIARSGNASVTLQWLPDTVTKPAAGASVSFSGALPTFADGRETAND